MCIIYLRRSANPTAEQENSASFCTRLYDSVQGPFFQFDTRSHKRFGRVVPVEEDDSWLRPLKGSEWNPAKGHHASNELFDLIRVQLPKTLQRQASTCPSPSLGIFSYFTIEDDLEHPGQASINMRSDVYRQYTFEDLCDLDPEMFPSIERIDLDRIRNSHNFVSWNPQVLKVSLEKPDEDSTDELILKIGELPDYEGPDRLPQRMEQAKVTQRLHFQELVNWSKVWGHENIMSPPKYLVTVQDGNRVKLVGWLQEVHRDWSDALLRPHRNNGDHATARKLLGYVTDLARGMLHMTKKGYIHPDIKCHNTLFAGPENADHLIIFDFQSFPQGPGAYYNLTGPESPEVKGDWDVSFDDTGRLRYSRNDPRDSYKEFSILVDWAEYPEALERLQVFTFACVAAGMLHYRSPDRDHWSLQQLTDEESEASIKARIEWEVLVPDAAKALLEECWSFDPRQRPLFQDILDRLEEIRNAMDGSSITNVALHQSQGGASSV